MEKVDSRHRPTVQNLVSTSTCKKTTIYTYICAGQERTVGFSMVDDSVDEEQSRLPRSFVKEAFDKVRSFVPAVFKEDGEY